MSWGQHLDKMPSCKYTYSNYSHAYDHQLISGPNIYSFVKIVYSLHLTKCFACSCLILMFDNVSLDGVNSAPHLSADM